MKTNFFTKLLYPPHYLSMGAAGVDIRDRSVRYIEFADKRGALSVKHFGEIPLPADTVKGGEIVNPTALAKVLSEIRTKLSSDFVRIAIPEEQAYIFDTQVPILPGSNVRESIELGLEENVPLTADEVSFEYDAIRKSGRENTATMLASVSVIPKKTIASFTDACAEAGLAPVSFEIESRMVARSVSPRGNGKTFLVVHIKENSTLLLLIASDTVRFTSTVPVGGASLIENPEAFSAIRDEIDKFGEYLSSKSDEKGTFLSKMIDQIILSGRSAAIPGLAGRIGQVLAAPVALANVWTNAFDINARLPRLAFEDSLDFATAIGLALA